MFIKLREFLIDQQIFFSSQLKQLLVINWHIGFASRVAK